MRSNLPVFLKLQKPGKARIILPVLQEGNLRLNLHLKVTFSHLLLPESVLLNHFRMGRKWAPVEMKQLPTLGLVAAGAGTKPHYTAFLPKLGSGVCRTGCVQQCAVGTQFLLPVPSILFFKNTPCSYGQFKCHLFHDAFPVTAPDTSQGPLRQQIIDHIYVRNSKPLFSSHYVTGRCLQTMKPPLLENRKQPLLIFLCVSHLVRCL